MFAHPAKGDLRALPDGELSAFRAVVIRIHLAKCAKCRMRRRRIQRTSAQAEALLFAQTPTYDLERAWLRVRAEAGDAPAPALVKPLASFAAGIALMLVSIGIALAAWPEASLALAVRFTQHAQIAEDTCCTDRDGDGIANDGVVRFFGSDAKPSLSLFYTDGDRSHSLSSGDILGPLVRSTPR